MGDLGRPASSGTQTKIGLTMTSVAELQKDFKAIVEQLAELRERLTRVEGRDEMQAQALGDLREGQVALTKAMDSANQTLTEIAIKMATREGVERELRERARSAPRLTPVPPPVVSATPAAPLAPVALPRTTTPPAVGTGGASELLKTLWALMPPWLRVFFALFVALGVGFSGAGVGWLTGLF